MKKHWPLLAAVLLLIVTAAFNLEDPNQKAQTQTQSQSQHSPPPSYPTFPQSGGSSVQPHKSTTGQATDSTGNPSLGTLIEQLNEIPETQKPEKLSNAKKIACFNMEPERELDSFPRPKSGHDMGPNAPTWSHGQAKLFIDSIKDCLTEHQDRMSKVQTYVSTPPQPNH